MNIFWAIVLLVGGLVILWKCADLLVAGAVALAGRLGVSGLVIGLTIVAMGTSAPEVAASIAAATRGAGDVAIGNVYGSNIANLALVGGLCAVIAPITIQLRTLKREMPVMLMAALLLWPFLQNLSLSRPEGAGLLSLFVALILLTVYFAKREMYLAPQDTRYEIRDTKKSILLIVVGLAGLALGADMTVRGAVYLGERVGLSKAVIGLTIIAIGTSLPELATCVAAALKKHHDISIGIMVGSNVFNALLAIGVAGVIRPFNIVPRLAGVDYWIMIIITTTFVLMAGIGRRISRVNGFILLAAYTAYIVYLFAYSR